MRWPVFPAKNEKSFLEHFLGSTLDPNRWTTITSGTGSVSVTDSYAECNSGASNNAAGFYRDAKINKNISQLWLMAASTTTSAQSMTTCFFVLNKGSSPIADTYSNTLPSLRIFADICGGAGHDEARFSYYDTAHAQKRWDGVTTQTWGTTDPASTPTRFNDYYVLGFEIDGPGLRWRLHLWGKTYVSGYTYEQGLRQFAMSDWVNWSAMEVTEDLWLVFGNPWTDAGVTGAVRFEWIRYIESVQNTVVDAWVQAFDAAPPCTIQHHYSYDGETFLRESRTSNAITLSGSAFEAYEVTQPDACTDGITDYLFYTGTASDFSTKVLALATAPHASPQNGPWTKQGVILNNIPGGQEDGICFAFTIQDISEPNASKRWKKLYSGISSVDTFWRVFYATAPAAAGPWTRQGLLIDLGPAGAPDEKGIASPAAVWIDDHWEVWYEGRDTNLEVTLMCAKGADLGSVVKDGKSYLKCNSGADTALTANLTGRTLTVTSTANFAVDAEVTLDQDTNIANFGTSRVRKIVSSTQLELYHGLDGFTTVTPARIGQVDSFRYFSPRNIYKVGSEWWFYVTIYGAFWNYDGASYAATSSQQAGLYKHSGTFPSDATPVIQHLTFPITSRGFNGDTRTCENISILVPPFWKSYDIYLTPGAANPNDIILFDTRYALPGSAPKINKGVQLSQSVNRSNTY